MLMCYVVYEALFYGKISINLWHSPLRLYTSLYP